MVGFGMDRFFSWLAGLLRSRQEPAPADPAPADPIVANLVFNENQLRQQLGMRQWVPTEDEKRRIAEGMRPMTPEQLARYSMRTGKGLTADLFGFNRPRPGA